MEIYRKLTFLLRQRKKNLLTNLAGGGGGGWSREKAAGRQDNAESWNQREGSISGRDLWLNTRMWSSLTP